jgi:hypothetical protein
MLASSSSKVVQKRNREHDQIMHRRGISLGFLFCMLTPVVRDDAF